MCFTDDDAIWNSYFLKYLLVPFNDDKMGGTGSNQIMRPVRMDVPPTTFERIGDMRLSSRMLEAAASTFYDGSVSCLSGRTALYHKRIIEPLDKFEAIFCNEYWFKCAPDFQSPIVTGMRVHAWCFLIAAHGTSTGTMLHPCSDLDKVAAVRWHCSRRLYRSGAKC
jgi:hypothetical protein